MCGKNAEHVPMIVIGTDLITLTIQTSPAGADACQAPQERKENFMLFSDHNGSLPRRQPGAMTIGHSPKGKGNS